MKTSKFAFKITQRDYLTFKSIKKFFNLGQLVFENYICMNRSSIFNKKKLHNCWTNFSNYGNSGTKGMAKVRFAGISNATSKQYAEEYI